MIKNKCDLCASRNIKKLFTKESHDIFVCNSCELQFFNPQPSFKILKKIYSRNYFLFGSKDKENFQHMSSLKRATAKENLALISTYYPERTKIQILEIGSGYGDFLIEANNLGFNVTGVEYSKNNYDVIKSRTKNLSIDLINGEIFDLVNLDKQFDIIYFCDVLEHVTNINLFIDTVKKLLKKNGIIFCIVPSTDHISYKLMKKKWPEYKLEHLYYFNKKNLKQFLKNNDFLLINVGNSKKHLSIKYINEHFKKFKVPIISPIINFLTFLLPKSFKEYHFDVSASGIFMIAKKNEN